MKKKLNRKKDVLAYIIYTDKDVNVNKEFTQKRLGSFLEFLNQQYRKQ